MMLMINVNYRILTMLLLSCFLASCATSMGIKRPVATSKRISISGLVGRVVLDPGHGGEDAGAVGPTGLKEKEVTLDIALRIRRLLRKMMPQVEVVLTRQSDHYLSLEDRVKKANEVGADVFLSIHINSSEKKDASGFELFSLDVASNRHADRLAARENIRSSIDEKAIKFILADLRANAHRQESDQLASLIAKGLRHQLPKKIPETKLKDRGYNQAIFHVLFVNMPAILGEMFFISNPDEERMLKSAHVRELCARGMVLGLSRYLTHRVARVQHGK